MNKPKTITDELSPLASIDLLGVAFGILLPNGFFDIDTIRRRRKDSVKDYCARFFVPTTWHELKKDGYKCVRLNIHRNT